MIHRLKLIITAAVCIFPFALKADENIGGKRLPIPNQHEKSLKSFCTEANSQEDLDINNVRATILTGGDMWWNLTDGKYLVPKPAPGANGPTALFAGSLWIGGLDGGGSLKMAAMTYRQSGSDFSPGPLAGGSSGAVISQSECQAYDRFWKLNKQDVINWYDWVKSGVGGVAPVSSDAYEAITTWPWQGPNGQTLAPFYDANNNNVYEPFEGDYPDFWLGDGTRTDSTATPCDAKVFGDQVLFWVFNDKGNVHTETVGEAIGLEVQSQAFAFATNDEVNNMTFYNFTVINRSTSDLNETYFGAWVDADLGSANDDYVGCDVNLGLGYCYNGDLIDDNPPAGQIPYYANPPAIGCDFFEGPYADPNGIDDASNSVPPSFLGFGDGVVDNERIGMSKFVYYNNSFALTGNPVLAIDYYNYLKGIWKDGTQMTYGGSGHISSGTSCSYMFPGDSDPSGFGTGFVSQSPWSEVTANNAPKDRRFLQSAGPFTLKAGAVNKVTTGLVWARATQGGNLASVALMKGADVKAQDLFNNCFALLEGPDAPVVAVAELKNQLVLTWTNPLNSNNVNGSYEEDYDKASTTDSAYRFQGYIVYQLRDATVTSAELDNDDKARLVAQCDIVDGVTQIVNYYNNPSISALEPKEMVNGANNGIFHSLSVTEDKFAEGANKLVNFQSYYFMVIAYAYSPTQIPDFSKPKDYLPFISGSKLPDGTAIQAMVGIPHPPSPTSFGTVQNSNYGTQPSLTRIEGNGNGGNILNFTSSTVNAILSSSSGRVINPVYEGGAGPVTIKVVDPLSVPANNNFQFKLLTNYDPTTYSVQNTSTWELTNLTTGKTVTSDKTIALPNEQIINGQNTGTSVVPTWGLSVNVAYVSDTTLAKVQPPNGGFLSGEMIFADESKKWLSGYLDEDAPVNQNWIRSGTQEYEEATEAIYSDYDPNPADTTWVDPNQYFENIINRTWSPYRLCAGGSAQANPPETEIFAKGAPAWYTKLSSVEMKFLASVDVVITADKALWTRCPVLEECDYSGLAVGGALKLDLRKQASVDKNGVANFPSPDNNDFATGMGWFPGYAINLETGERLNMAFGENSWLKSENGGDMKWNPTSKLVSETADQITGQFNPIFGGMHYVYVFGHNGDKKFTSGGAAGLFQDIPRYDQGKAVHDLLQYQTTSIGTLYKGEVFNDAMWVNIPLLAEGHSLFETTVTCKIRVAKPWAHGYSNVWANPPTNNILSADTAVSPQNGNFPMYSFNTDGIGVRTNDSEVAEDALSLINVVPNPYYAYSGYERSALENIVKITNLPPRCDISIFTFNGTLIRKMKKDDNTKTYLDWDLKNQFNVPIAGGMYIIHVNVPNVGEKIVKWFGVLRPIDLDQF